MYIGPVPLKKNKVFPISFSPQIDTIKYSDLREVVDGAQKDLVMEQTKHHKILGNIIGKTNTVLFRAKAAWPFELFRNEIIINTSCVTIIKREFFSSGNMESLYINDLMRISVETGPLFSTLRLVDKSFDTTKHFIDHLKRSDAFRARDILQGLLTAVKSGVDLAKIDIGYLAPSIPKLSGTKLIPSI